MEQNYSLGSIDLFGQSHYCSIENGDVNVVWKLLGKMNIKSSIFLWSVGVFHTEKHVRNQQMNDHKKKRW